VKWKVPLPDRGNSTPIVWGSRVFVTQPLEKENRRTLLCLDRADGKLLWQSGVTYTDKEASHKTNPQCSASPVTDGERVIAFFGSAGLFAYDFNGKELWRRELGKHIHEWGNAASPVLHGDLCILNFGPGPNNFLLAVDKRTGKTVWKVATPDEHPAERTDGFKGQKKGVIGSWSTPILVKAGGRDELVMSYPNDLRAFNPQTGALLWKCDGLNPLIYTSPIFGDGVVVGMGGFYGTTIAAKTGGSGDVTATHRLCASRAHLHPQHLRHRRMPRTQDRQDRVGGAPAGRRPEEGIVVLAGARGRPALHPQPERRHRRAARRAEI
jgi:outer membrane protein assembly factor BamB